MISFIIPSHNYGALIGDCIFSILKNEKKFIKEIIVINDSSGDNTDEIVKKIKKKSKKIRYFKKQFKNLAKTMNYGISKASGGTICKIDADDTIDRSFAKDLYNFFSKTKSDFVYPDIIINDRLKKVKYTKKQKIDSLSKIFLYPHGSGCLFKKKLWEKVGGYNQKNYYQDDYDFWIKINKIKNVQIKHLNKALYIYNKHSSNMSRSKIKKNFTKAKIFLLNMMK